MEDDSSELIRIIPAPPWSAEWPSWRRRITRWRTAARVRMGYDGTPYARPETAWTQRCFACAMLMMWDAVLYNGQSGRFQPEALIEQGRREFGGYDAVLLWQAYPRIGFDERNQFDFFRELPGGIGGLKELVARFHILGVRVILPLNPWDRMTRPERRHQVEVLSDIVRMVHADGVFLDTLSALPLSQDAPNGAARDTVLETEGSLPLARIGEHHMSWGQGFEDTTAPGVLRNKWFEPRHIVHMIERWAHDHTAELHSAWMNGAGMMVWENVFGTWVGWNARDRSLLRSMLPVQRRFARHFTEGEWVPLIATAGPVYATRWDLDGVRLWTIINREERWVDGPLLRLDSVRDEIYLDLVQGVEVAPVRTGAETVLPGTIGPRGISAIVAMRESDRPHMAQFLGDQARTYARASWDSRFPARRVTRRPVSRAERRELPAGMIAVPGGTVRLTSTFRERECGTYDEHPFDVDYETYQYDPESPTDLFGSYTRTVDLRSFAIDANPVSNGEFAIFLGESKYAPRHPENFLKHWIGGVVPPAGADQPVVYVDLDDARAYAAWAGKRLPTDEEWQHAMQSQQVEHGAPRVWNWTESERSDGRTRWCLIKGGSDFQATGSLWYADGGHKEPAFSAKFILFWPGLDRCSTIGFRCAIDLC